MSADTVTGSLSTALSARPAPWVLYVPACLPPAAAADSVHDMPGRPAWQGVTTREAAWPPDSPCAFCPQAFTPSLQAAPMPPVRLRAASHTPSGGGLRAPRSGRPWLRLISAYAPWPSFCACCALGAG